MIHQIVKSRQRSGPFTLKNRHRVGKARWAFAKAFLSGSDGAPHRLSIRNRTASSNPAILCARFLAINDMVKKRKARRGANASKRTRSAKATARRPGVKAVKKKLRKQPARTAEKQNPKSKRRTGLHAKGGGNATAAGVTFQA